MIKITDLLSNKDIIELKESEEEKITGGGLDGEACSPRGARITWNGNDYLCKDRPLWFRDEWKVLD